MNNNKKFKKRKKRIKIDAIDYNDSLLSVNITMYSFYRLFQQKLIYVHGHKIYGTRETQPGQLELFYISCIFR